jgi:hypothetical protein
VRARAPHLDYDDHQAFAAAFASWPCRFCPEAGAHFIGPGTGDHYAAIYCLHCGKFLRWLPWPPRSKAEQKQKRRTVRLERLADDLCDFCLRPRAALPPGVRLESRHRIDRATLIDKGAPPDEADNLGWICSAPCKGIEIALRAGFDYYGPWFGEPTGIERLPLEADE